MQQDVHPISRLFDVIEGPIRFGLTQWAIQAGVFDRCTQPVLAKDLARDLGTDAKPTERALQALTSAGFLDCNDGWFALHPDYALYLSSTSDQSFTQTFLDLSRTRHSGLDDLPLIIAGNAVEGDPVRFDAAHWQRMQRSLSAFHKAVAADFMLDALTQLPEWEAMTNMMDVGGGSFELANRIVEQKPEAQVTVFDLEGMIDSLGAPDHSSISVARGSYNMADSVPGGPFDTIWCSMSLYFAEESLTGVLETLTNRLSPKGALVSFHEDLSEDRCHPSRHVVGRTMPALAGKDLSFSAGFVAQAMQSAGLRDVTSDRIDTPFGEYRLDVGRKPPE